MLKPENDIGSTNSKDKILTPNYEKVIENLKRQIRSSFFFGKKSNLASFPSKSLDNTVISVIKDSQKMSTLTIATTTTSTRTDITLQANAKHMRPITVCSKFKPDCRPENTNIEFIGNVHYLNKICSKKLCVHKKTVQYLGGGNYQCPQCASQMPGPYNSPWRTNKLPFSDVSPSDLNFWWNAKKYPTRYCICVLPKK